MRLPQDVIDCFEDTAYLSEGDGPHINIYTREERDSLLAAFRDLPRPLDPDTAWQVRELTGSLKEVQLKGKGRLTLPREYRDHGGFEGKEQLLLLGVLDHLEVWSPETYKAAKERRRAQQIIG